MKSFYWSEEEYENDLADLEGSYFPDYPQPEIDRGDYCPCEETFLWGCDECIKHTVFYADFPTYDLDIESNIKKYSNMVDDLLNPLPF